MISSKDKVKMFEMRVSGCTLQEIGDEFGVTRERVRQILSGAIRERKTNMNEIIYVNIAKWLKENEISLSKFSKMLDPKANSSTRLKNKLTKSKSELKISQIKKILEITGMTFEKAFEEEL